MNEINGNENNVYEPITIAWRQILELECIDVIYLGGGNSGFSDLAQHFHKNHRLKDMEIFILQTGINDEKEREFYEDKWICKLQTFKDINTELHQYAKDMYGVYNKLNTNEETQTQ